MSAAQPIRGRLNMQLLGLNIYASRLCDEMRAHAAMSAQGADSVGQNRTFCGRRTVHPQVGW